MSAVSDHLEVLYRTPDEVEAAMIADLLREHGIRSSTTGGYTLGFRAEAPGELGILIAGADLPVARGLLEQHLRESQPVDWSTVDCQDPTSADANEAEDQYDGETPPASSAKFQFSLGTLVLIQTGLCVVLAFWHLVGGGEVAALLLCLVLFSLALSGTIYIATHFGHFSNYWRPPPQE